MIIIAETKQENEIVEQMAKNLPGARAITREEAYAVNYWSIEDVIGHNDSITKEGAEAFLEYYENRLKEGTTEGGNDFLDYADYDGYKLLKDDEEDYEVVEILDKLMLFSNGRIRKWQVPEGLYLYHLRESDDGDRFCSIESNVAVNHGGSILSKEPLDLGPNGYISFTEDTEPNFVGCDVSINDFISGNFSID